MIEPNHPGLSIKTQCQLLDLPRSSYYYRARETAPEELIWMRRIDELFTAHPHLGSRGMRDQLRLMGHKINRKKVQRLMRVMSLESVAPRPGTSKPHPEHKVYPYLLRHVPIQRVGQVWSADITYIPMARSYLYLVAIIDWYSRYIVSWELSNSLEVGFCQQVLEDALTQGTPEIFNTDQGAQFTSPRFTQILKEAEVQISMDGKGRALDNIWVERFWRSLKYEEVYLNEYEDGLHCFKHLEAYFRFYNHGRAHSSLGGKTPAMVHFNQPFDPSGVIINHPISV